VKLLTSVFFCVFCILLRQSGESDIQQKFRTEFIEINSYNVSDIIESVVQLKKLKVHENKAVF